MFMAIAVCFSSFADSITIKEAEKGKTYDLYRIFDLTGKDTHDPEDGVFELYSYTVNPAWNDFFFGEGAPGKEFLVLKENDTVPDEYKGLNELTYVDASGKKSTYFMNITDDNVADLSQKALAYSVKLAAPDYTDKASDGDLTFDGVKLGYYLVYPRGAADIKSGYASICSLQSTTPDAEIEVKATYPTIDKEVDDPSVEVGQTVTFTVTGQVPDTTGYTEYKYIVTDTMTKGLKFDGTGSVKVTIGGADNTGYKSLKDSGENGFILEYDMTEFQGSVGEKIVITYTATVTDDAVCEVTTNSAKLKYSNDPRHATDSDYLGETPRVEKEVYSSKIKVIKIDNATPDTKNLEGAEFCLRSATPSDAQYYKYTEGDDTTPSKVEWVATEEEATKVTTKADGTAEFTGLEDGTYYLREIKAPAGYSLLDHDVEITVAGTQDKDKGKMVGVTVEEKIVNVPGKLLPKTGGTGTTILYIVGGILVVGAGILLITKKRVEDEE